jgi:UDP-D-galactose:(glucosyl)LPS alpha-1,6-D-galactosyltransferase
MGTKRRIAVMVRRLSGRGGMEQVIRTLATAAGRAEPPTSVEVWCFGVPHDAQWLSDLPHRIVNIDQGTGRWFQLGTKLFFYTRAVRRFIRESAPDVLLATDPVFVRAALLARGGNTAPRVFSWLHFAVDRVANRRWLVPADGHLAISTQIADEIQSLGAHHAPVTVGNPLPVSDYRLIPMPAPPARILYIGRLQNHQKRVDLLLAALGRLKDREFGLDIIGDGPDRDMLHELAEREGIQDRVVWHGWSADPWAPVKAATVLVLPSDFEGFPMVLLEALAHGIPVVATDCNAGPRDIVQPGANGFLVPIDDPAALAEALQPFLQDDAPPRLTWTAAERRDNILGRYAESVVWKRMADALSLES